MLIARLTALAGFALAAAAFAVAPAEALSTKECSAKYQRFRRKIGVCATAVLMRGGQCQSGGARAKAANRAKVNANAEVSNGGAGTCTFDV